jgi:hypothetical protein
MSGSRSKTKGSSWEREIAKYLSEQHGASFIRAAHSGAYIGGTNSFRKKILDQSQIKNFKGDIVPPETWVNFNAEAKNYADFPFHLLFQGTVPQLEQWLDQLMAVAQANDFNILLMKFNRKGSYIVHQLTPRLNLNSNYLIYNSNHHGSWIIQDFKTFWSNNKDIIQQICETSHQSK